MCNKAWCEPGDSSLRSAEKMHQIKNIELWICYRQTRKRLFTVFALASCLASGLILFIMQLSISNQLKHLPPEVLDGSALPRYNITLKPALPEFVEAVTKAQDENGVVIVLSASAGYLPNMLNSMCSMKLVGIKRALMVALDREIFLWANATDFFVPVMLPGAQESVSSKLIEYAKPGFSKVTMEKFQSVEPVLATGKPALFVDGDIFWCQRSPVREILIALNRQPPGRDIIFQTSFEHLQGETPLGDYINTGLFLARPTVAVRTFFLRIAEDAKRDKSVGDQRAVNNRLCKEALGGRVVYKENTGFLWMFFRRTPAYCERDGLQAGFLDVNRFPNGPSRSANSLTRPRRSQVRANCHEGKVAMLHNNYIEGAMKELRFKAQGLWYAADDGRSCLAQPLQRPITELRSCGRSCQFWFRDTSL